MNIESLLSSSGDTALAWLNNNLGNVKDFNWQLFAEKSNNNALRNFDGQNNNDIDKNWLRVAIKTYQYLSEKYGTGKSTSFTFSEMSNRATLISCLSQGEELDNEIDIIENWFFEIVTLDFNDVRSRLELRGSGGWSANDVKELRALRNIKRVLKTIQRISDSGIKLKSNKIYQWLEIENILP